MRSETHYVMELAGTIDMGKSSQVLGPADIKCIFVKGQEGSEQLSGRRNIWVFNPSHEALVECKAPVEQPGQATEVAFDNAAPEDVEAKQTFITDFFYPRPTTSSVSVPRSFNITRVFTRARSKPIHGGKKTEEEDNITESEASESFQLMMRDEEDEEEEKEGRRLKLVHLDITALLVRTTRFLDACGAAFMFTFTISIMIYGGFHWAL